MANILTITPVRRLSASDWNSIQGSPLHLIMMRNHIALATESRYVGNRSFELSEIVAAYLKKTCSGIYYILSYYVYFELETDMVAFTLYANGKEMTEMIKENPHY